MAIPINAINSIGSTGSGMKALETQKNESNFLDIFKNAINNVVQTDAVAKQDELLIATGQADNLHSITINATKAELALQTLVQIRNKAMDAYNEIMRMSL